MGTAYNLTFTLDERGRPVDDSLTLARLPFRVRRRLNQRRPDERVGRKHHEGLARLFSPSTASLGELLVGAGIAALIVWGVSEIFSTDAAPLRFCGVCGRTGHDRRTCPHDGQRRGFSRSLPKSSRCKCCGSSRYGTERHHTRGRSNPSDFLDVCLDCHVECCHDGHFRNLAFKPRTCRITGDRSSWCK
jgi:hypothetical protein